MAVAIDGLAFVCASHGLVSICTTSRLVVSKYVDTALLRLVLQSGTALLSCLRPWVLGQSRAVQRITYDHDTTNEVHVGVAAAQTLLLSGIQMSQLGPFFRFGSHDAGMS